MTVVLLTAGISWYAWKHHAFSLWLPAGAAGAFLGFIGLLAAPGNYVRYGEQGTGKGLLIHIGNQLAGNGEMFLYLLPAVLLLLLVWRVLKIHVLAERGVSWEWRPRGVSAGQIVCVLLLAAFVVSYFPAALSETASGICWPLMCWLPCIKTRQRPSSGCLM